MGVFGTMIIKVFYFTHNGNYRKNNEDSLLIHDTVVQTKQMKSFKYLVIDQKYPIFAVADGMGGHDKGEIASYTVLESLSNFKHKITSSKDIKNEIIRAKSLLNEKANSMNSPGLGTTLCGIYFINKKALVYSVGDSRAYLLSSLKMERITEDHSEVFELFRKNNITEEELRVHKRKNILTSAIVGDLTDKKPMIYEKELKLTIGSTFLLCTDGLWEGIPHDMFNQFLEKNRSEETFCNQLITFSLKYSGLDNISFILIKVVDI
jgi:serine/threonine protein phosphatase PrpC